MIARGKFWWRILYAGDAKGILAGLAVHTGQISVGLSQGFSAVLVPKLLESEFATISEASWTAALGVISNPIGALLAGLVAEFCGRRSAVALATFPHFTGWLLIALSTNVPMLYVGRFISGLGTGMANGLYLYVSEAAAPHQRGWLASSGPALVSFGVLMVYTLGTVTSWQRTAAISIGPAILSLALCRLIPESPSWLAAKGRLEEAKEALLWLRGPGATTELEHRELCATNVQQAEKKKTSLFKTLHEPSVWKPFLVLFAFFALQQLCGIYIVLFYAVTVLEDVGVTIDTYVGSVGIGAVRLFAAILGAGLARVLGRRTLACISGLGMAVSAGGVAMSIRIASPSWVPLMCVACHVGFSMIGYLTLPWVMTSELYPLRFRGALSGLTTGFAQLMTFAAIKVYPDVSTTVGLQATMWAFSGASFLGAVFALTILPETRGRSLDEIERRFSNGAKDLVDEESPAKTAPVPRKKVAPQSEDKLSDATLPTISQWTNVYVYDNLGLDVSSENPRKVADTTERRSSSDHEDKNFASVEQVYL